jgi:hypothetical protein
VSPAHSPAATLSSLLTSRWNAVIARLSLQAIAWKSCRWCVGVARVARWRGRQTDRVGVSVGAGGGANAVPTARHTCIEQPGMKAWKVSSFMLLVLLVLLLALLLLLLLLLAHCALAHTRHGALRAGLVCTRVCASGWRVL